MLVHLELTIAAALAHALFAVNLTNVIICDIYLIKNALHLFFFKVLAKSQLHQNVLLGILEACGKWGSSTCLFF